MEHNEKDVNPNAMCNGRLLVVVGDNLTDDMKEVLSVLEKAPKYVRLGNDMMTEAASVQTSLYSAAGVVLEEIDPLLRKYNTSAVHLVGRSLGGGIAALSAAILEGSLRLPSSSRRKRRSKKTTKSFHERG